MTPDSFEMPSGRHPKSLERGWRAEWGVAPDRVSFKPRLSAIAFLLLTLAISTPASAGGPTGSNKHAPLADADPLRASVARWDANHDGVYTCAEWQSYMTRLFSLADPRGKGFLDSKGLADIAAREPLFRNADLAFFDSDANGKISRFEFLTAPSPFFTEFDSGHTCAVTAAALDKKTATNPRSGKSRNGGSAIGQ